MTLHGIRTQFSMKRAGLGDRPSLIEMMAEFYAEAGYTLNRPHATEALTTLLADERLGSVWLIQSASETIGYIVLTLKYGMEYGGLMACVDDFFIRTPFRNAGVGTEALKAIREFCEAQHIRAMTVEVGPDNEAAKTVYRRTGFVETDHLMLSLAIAPPTHTA